MDCLLSSSSSYEGEPVVGQTVETEGWKAVRQGCSSIGVSSVVETIGITKRKGVNYRSSHGNWSSSSILESSFKSSLSSSNFFRVIQISSSNLFCLYIIVHRCKSSMFASSSCIKSSLELSLGSSNLRSIIQGSSNGNSHNKYQLEHVEWLTRESSEQTPPAAAASK